MKIVEKHPKMWDAFLIPGNNNCTSLRLSKYYYLNLRK